MKPANLSEEEQSRLRAVLEQKTVSFRDKAITLLCLTSGIRACDLIKLTLQDINWQIETISFTQKKTGNAVILPILPAVGNAIANYLMLERPKAMSNILFVRQLAPYQGLSDHSSCYQIIKRIFRLANIDCDEHIYGTRLLRHNAASSMLKHEVPIETIAAVLGHADPNSTDIYLTTEENPLRSCVLPLFPMTQGVLK